MSAIITNVYGQNHGRGTHPPMPDQKLYVYFRLETEHDPIVIESPIKLDSPTRPTELSQVIGLSTAFPKLRLVEYLPSATLTQSVQPDPNGHGKPAIELSVIGASQSVTRWLVADDVERNRLISYIATWRYMAVPDRVQRDALFDQFKNELTRTPQLRVTRKDGTGARTMDAVKGATATFDEWQCTVRVKRFFSHFAIDDSTAKPANMSDKRLNPAVLIEIERDGDRSERWVFAKFPDYGSDGDTSGLSWRLDCPQDKQSSTPDYVLVTIGNASNEVWTRQRSRTTAKPLALLEPFPIAGSSYAFQVDSFVPSATLVERYTPTSASAAVPALKIEVRPEDSDPETHWLELGKQRVLRTSAGPLTVGFGPLRDRDPGAKTWSHD